MSIRNDVQKLYAMIGRTDETPQEIGYWVDQATAGNWTADQLAWTFINAAADYPVDATTSATLRNAVQRAIALRDQMVSGTGGGTTGGTVAGGTTGGAIGTGGVTLPDLPPSLPATVFGVSTKSLLIGLAAYVVLRRVL